MPNAKEENIFSDMQEQKIKSAFKALDSTLGVDAFDEAVQLKILRSNLLEIRAKRKSNEVDGEERSSGSPKLVSDDIRGQEKIPLYSATKLNGQELQKNTVTKRIVLFIESLVTSTRIAMAMTFALGVMLTVSYYQFDGSFSEDEIVVRSDSTSQKDIELKAPNPVEKRSQIIESALRANLKVSISKTNDSIMLRVENLRADDPTQLAFKALVGLLPGQDGVINLKFER